MKVKCVIYKVGCSSTKDGKPFGIVEGISDIGIFKVFTTYEASKEAAECKACLDDCADDNVSCFMLIEPYIGKDYKVNARVVGFAIE